MKRILATAAILASTAAFADTDRFIEFEAADIDDDGFISLAEIESIWPRFDPVFFNDMDINDDNRLDSREYDTSEAQDILARYGNNVLINGENATAIAADDLQPGLPAEIESNVIITDVPMLEGIIDRETVDANDSGFVEYAELTPYFPGLEQADYQDMDVNDDNRLDFTELYSDDAIVILNR
ncbi:EF hand domain-containing protein [Hasllibacter halocynthiae]|uniref:EF hand domain-containing protein n=1 Tax=Hasllibacter halocynthiae TaxID=595589 RepID=A0A2T0X975_9RHOB|nr:hypothetical protein [Hasllibacter halocynthiae]PRY95501.1 EF hand domain-containing protein [Hasllibacter halocynthiae]